MKTNVYIIKDVIADEVTIMGMCKTDGLFIRQNLPFLQKLNPNFMNEMEIYRIGEFVDSSMSVNNLPAPELVSWDTYRRPEQDEGTFNAKTVVKSDNK